MGVFEWLGNFFNPYKKSINDRSNTEGGNTIDIVNALKMTNLSGISGIPYQFLPNVDRRINADESDSTKKSIKTTNKKYPGRKYTDKILSKMPLLFLTPCRQTFMEEYTKDDKHKVLQSLIEGTANLKDSIDSAGRYYSTSFAYDEYYGALNNMASEVCYFLGIGEEKIFNNTKLKNMDWRSVLNSAFKNYFAASQAVVFYLDGLTTMSDSFSTSTTDSSLASTINGYSDQFRELQFLMPNSALSSLAANTSDEISNALGSITSISQGLTGSMLTDLANTGVNSVLQGGKMIFPKIWGDSQFNRSYSFTIKLRSPDHDSVSIFLNVILPYLQLLAFCLPQSVDNQNPNAYQTPFLCRAYCKGMFNIDMGIITDMSVERGAEMQWNDNGLPTQIDINITIEDLYSSLVMTRSSNQLLKGFNISNNWDIVSNTSMVDFLANLSGLNVADQEIGRRERMIVYLTTSTANRVPSDIWGNITSGVSNIIRNVYRLI